MVNEVIIWVVAFLVVLVVYLIYENLRFRMDILRIEVKESFDRVWDDFNKIGEWIRVVDNKLLELKYGKS